MDEVMQRMNEGELRTLIELLTKFGGVEAERLVTQYKEELERRRRPVEKRISEAAGKGQAGGYRKRRRKSKTKRRRKSKTRRRRRR